MGFAPTAEQLVALDLFKTGNSLAIEAGAGAGKTSTLILFAESTSRRGQYIAFNKPIVQEAAKKMPETVNVATAHSLAHTAVVKACPVTPGYAERLQNARRMKPMELAVALKANPLQVTTFTGESRSLGAGFMAGLALRTVKRFCQSADLELLAKHVPFIDGLDMPLHAQHGPLSYGVNAAVAQAVLPLAKLAWKDLRMYEGAMPFTHDHYLKMWQLKGPKIECDYIMFDEAQDANPVLQAIVLAQTHAQLVWVGDSQQSIYGFTGAVNALASVPSDSRTFLTQSFRFGPAVADVANEVLGRLNAELRLTGTTSIPSVVEGMDDPNVILTRTNAGAVRAMFAAQKLGKKVHLVGGSSEIAAFARAARDLMEGKRVDHPELACFESWDEVLSYVEEDEDGGDLKLLVNMVEDFEVEPILTALTASSQERYADLVISTAHKSKGKEWDRVKLGGDFPSGERAKDEELRLLYVAVTRAKLALDITAVATLNKEVEAEHEQKRERKNREPVKVSAHVGTVGEKSKLARLLVVGCRPFESQYGGGTIVEMLDADGNRFKWLTSTDDVEEGNTVTATWEVKKHEEYRGSKETRISRPAGMVVE